MFNGPFQTRCNMKVQLTPAVPRSLQCACATASATPSSPFAAPRWPLRLKWWHSTNTDGADVTAPSSTRPAAHPQDARACVWEWREPRYLFCRPIRTMCSFNLDHTEKVPSRLKDHFKWWEGSGCQKCVCGRIVHPRFSKEQENKAEWLMAWFLKKMLKLIAIAW